jgi:hypothetical protein
MSKRAFSEIRNVKVYFNNAEGTADGSEVLQAAMSIDAYKAAIGKVEEIESNYFNDSSLGDLTAADVVMTGASRYKLHSFTVTTVLATGKYTFIFNETVPNAASLS